MRIGVLGTGVVGQTLASRFVELGHDVVMGARDAANEKAAAWAAEAGDRGAHGTFADAARHGDLVVNATAGVASVGAILSADPADLDGKPLLDVANPLDSSAGFPPRLAVDSGDSVAEQIQRAVPQARVVKALNTVTASVMVRPERAGAGHEVFVAGDDPEAKAKVAALLQQLGWPAEHIRDLGGLSAARGLEAYVLFWVGLRVMLGTNEFNIRIVRPS